MPTIWRDRQHAGITLAQELLKYTHAPDTLVLAIPRGGVAVAREIAEVLNVPLDIVVTRKIGAPWNEEFAIGAVDIDGEVYLDEAHIAAYEISDDDIQKIKEREMIEAQRRFSLYRSGRPLHSFEGKTLILVDDGIATGATMLLAIRYCRRHGAKRIVVAVPVLSDDALFRMEGAADEVVYLSHPPDFMAVGQYYRAFESVSDEEVIRLLGEA